MVGAFVAMTSVIAGCATRESRARVDGRLVVMRFDAIMNAGEGRRAPFLEAFRREHLVDRKALRTRDTCVRMFDAVALASEIQDRLEPMADQLDALADAGVVVPPEQRANVVLLYQQATGATDRASAALSPCVNGIDSLRVHAARRR